jgi:hypothetical protein
MGLQGDRSRFRNANFGLGCQFLSGVGLRADRPEDNARRGKAMAIEEIRRFICDPSGSPPPATAKLLLAPSCCGNLGAA